MERKTLLFLQAAAGSLFGLLVLFFMFYGKTGAATNISSVVTEHWAWNDIIGWMDFYNTNTVNVTNSQLTGYASSSIGSVSFDCATSPGGNVCGTSNYKVYNDGLGDLSGFAWNDVYGWISFCGGQGTPNCPNNSSSIPYEVIVGNADGVFQGSPTAYAWNDIVGWMSFNCGNGGPGGTSVCGTSNYKVITSWRAVSATGTLDSATFDTGVSRGAQINSVLWRGDMPVGTLVGFQFASANSSSGPWNYAGPDGSATTYYYPTAPNASMALDYTLQDNYRFFRYRVTLFSDASQKFTPRVDDVVVNWSP